MCVLGCLVLGCYLLLNTYNLAWLLRPGTSKLGALMAEHRRDYTQHINIFWDKTFYFLRGQPKIFNIVKLRHTIKSSLFSFYNQTTKWQYS